MADQTDVELGKDEAGKKKKKIKNPAILPMEYQLKKYLLLLATLVATVTYAAGLNPPGGSWLEDGDTGTGTGRRRHFAGDSILRETNYVRYMVFYCFNAISFAASLIVSLLLLLLHRGDQGWLLKLTRGVMVVDLLGLMGAYAAGGSHDLFTTVCAAGLVGATFACIIFTVPSSMISSKQDLTTTKTMTTTTATSPAAAADHEQEQSKHEILLVLAIFVATIAYVAGLNPPGGFWRSTAAGHHTAGDPVLQGFHPIRYKFFFFSNTAAFVASLLAITFTTHEKLDLKTIKAAPLCALIVTAILGLGGAYAAGSCRDSKHTAYVLALIVPVLGCIILQRFLSIRLQHHFGFASRSTEAGSGEHNDLDKPREVIQLLAILAATIAYQAGVDPPGGVWADTGEGHIAGDPILRTTHPARYKVFFYSNSAAFVASLVIMVMLQSERLVRGHALEAAMILDLFGLIGAYAAGSSRDTSTSIYTLAIAGGVLVYVVIHILFFTLDDDHHSSSSSSSNNGGLGEQAQKNKKEEEEDVMEKKREVLLLLAILAATLTYQAGLTPPGGMWENDRSGHHAGFPVLMDKYPRRYKAFFYCNTASFMASVALIVLLLNRNLYGPAIRCYALFVCMVAGLFGLIGAYAAGSSLHLGTSIVDLALVIAVFAIVVYVATIRHDGGRQQQGEAEDHKKNGDDDQSSATPTNQTSGQPSSSSADRTTTTQEQKPAADLKKEQQKAAADLKKEEEEQRKAAADLKKEEEEQRKAAADLKKKKKKKKKAAEFDMMMSKYLMLVGILAASVTYLTGLKPPGGLWRESDDGAGHDAGNPVLYDIDKHRYNVFFYTNSTSFMASITVIALLLSRMIMGSSRPLWPMHTAMLLDMVALLAAYAAGSARDWCTSKDVALLLFPVLAFVLLLFFWRKQPSPPQPAQQPT